MSNKSEYSDLLDYLDRQEKHTSRPKKKEDKQKRKSPQQKVVKKEEKKQPSVDSFLNIDLSKTYSNGFSTAKFENLMRIKLLDNHKRMQSFDRPYISVSELYSCLRKVYYERMKYKVEKKKQFSFSYLFLIQEVGNVIHQLVQTLYDFEETEKSIVSESYKVKGRCDAIKEKFLYEIKSIDDKKFTGEIDKYHFFQANIYAHLLNTEYEYNIDTITIIYVLRSLKKIIALDAKINPDSAISFLKRSFLIQKSIKDKIPPDPIGCTKEQCNFCLYKDYCKKDGFKSKKPCLIINSKPIKKKSKKIKKEKKQDDKSVFLL